MRTRIRVILRQLAFALITACLVSVPVSVNALGFGNIRIKSALNEPLDAEIELLSATTADLKGLSIKLASSEAFMRAGVERPAHLAQLRFEIKRRSNDGAYLHITTKQSMREPFLDFLLEMNWKNGRMLREYTVLLDPPDQVQHQPTLVESPQTESPVVVAEQEQQETVTPFVEPEPKPVVTEEPEPAPTPVAAPVVAEEVPVADEPITTDSIAVADVEQEPVPLAETLTESELQVEETPVPLEDTATTAGSEDVALAEEADVDPFAGEKFPRIPINVDRRLREAEEAELAKLAVPATDAELGLTDTSVAVTESFGEPLEPLKAPKRGEITGKAKAEPAPLSEELVPLAEEGGVAAEDQMTGEQAVAEEHQQPLAEEAVADEKPQREPVDAVAVKKDDKLWNIAESMRPDESVSIYQVMMALLQNNPEAFVDNNVHRLKVGKVLRIDDPSMLTAMSKSQAAQAYIAQTQDWESYRQQVAGSAYGADTTPMQAETVSEPTRAAEVMPERAMAPGSGELVLSAPEGDHQTLGAGGGKESTVNNEVVILREEIRQALAEAEAEGNKNIILNEKLRDLEAQLQGLQRSVTVQDDELATLQKQLSDLNKKNVEAEQPAMAPSAPAEIPEAAAKLGAADNAVMSEAELLAQSEQADKPEAKPAPVEPTAPPAADSEQTTEAADESPGMLDGIKQGLGGMVSSLPFSPLVLLIGAGVIVVLLLLMLLLVQRRRQAVNFQESILSGIPSHEIMASEEASLETNLSGESSFLSDFAISGASALQGDDGDVDPLTEADVFMAYGRYEAAEERIKEAIKKDPARQELRIKLLELYNTTKNKPAFEAAAEELFTNLGSDASNPLWQKVVAMGAIIAADNPLFNDAGLADDVTRIRNKPATGAAKNLNFDAAAAGKTTVIDDLGLDLDFGAQDDSAKGNASLDFDLNLGSDETAKAADEDLDFKFDSDESIEFDASALDFSSDETAQTEVALDIELPGGDKTDEFKLDDALDFDMSDLEDDISGLDLQLSPSSTKPAKPGKGSQDMTLDMDMDVDTAVLDKDEGLTMEMSQPDYSKLDMPTIETEVDATDVADLDAPSIIDEVGTKLDLAKAYIDMGDPEGAKSILDEVMEEGTKAQQQEAKQLLKQI